MSDQDISPFVLENTRDLSPLQLQAFSLRLAGKSRTETATEIGVCRKTLYTWEHLPAWQAALNAYLKECRVLLTMRSMELVEGALQVLSSALTGRNVPTETRLAAARQVINTVIRLTEDAVHEKSSP
jgi:hypothetical protein